MKKMELKKADTMDWVRIHNALCRKQIPFCTPSQVFHDFEQGRLYAVVEDGKVLATVSLVEEPLYKYIAVKRLCILNKKNCGKGIARFALHAIQGQVSGRIGATPWEDNHAVRHILESEGFVLQYVFSEKWCFYMKEV